jgi:hypothetical protein
MTLNLDMDWKGWRLDDWNRALVQHIFFDEDRLTIPITRITASDRFLAECAGETVTGAEAHAAFLRVCGNSASDIRSLYEWSPKYKVLIQRNDIPSFMPALYLSLLAASADINTFDKGQYRDRFSELLKPLNVGSLGFEDLPKFWRLARDWSVDRNQRLGDCRILRLPDPLNEKRIGHSKRLVFPGYRDEKQLKSVLDSEGLNSSSDFRAVVKALYRAYHKFSSSFIEELEIFKSHVTKAALIEAYESPLWGAIQDILWEEDRDNSIKNGSLLIELHPDLYNPDFSILTDVQGEVKLSTHYQLIEISKKDKYQFSIFTPESETLVSSLKRIAQINSGFKETKLWKAFNSGLVCFFPNERGYLTSEGVFSDGAQSCFLVEKKLSLGLLTAARSFRVKPVVIGLENIAPGWELLAFESLSKADLETLSTFLPYKLQGLLSVGWKPPAVSIKGGSWFGQALLLNPSSNPIASFPDVKSGTYELLDKNGTSIQDGDLDIGDDGFYIPFKSVSGDLSSAIKVRYKFTGHESLPVATKVVPLIQDAPLMAPTKLPNPDAWLVNGKGGRLQNFSNAFAGAESVDKLVYDLGSFSPFISFVAAGSEPVPKKYLPNAVTSAEFLGWIVESLALRFQSRLTLPYRELMANLIGPEIVLETPRWQFRNLLFLSGQVMALESRRSSHLAIAAGHRTISLCKSANGSRCRIVGGLSKSEKYRLSVMLSDGEEFISDLDENMSLSIRAIELELSHDERILDIAKEFNLEILDRESFGDVLTPVNKISNTISNINLDGRNDLEVWDRFKRQWRPFDQRNQSETNLLVRMKGRQRNRFWVTCDNVAIETDSEVWAKIFLCSALGMPIAKIQKDGSCVFNELISGLPESLTRWWLHWGGGEVSYAASGALMLAGSVDPDVWAQLGSWIRESSDPHLEAFNQDYSLDRRKFALQKALIKRNKDYYFHNGR